MLGVDFNGGDFEMRLCSLVASLTSHLSLRGKVEGNSSVSSAQAAESSSLFLEVGVKKLA